jgi:YrbI family 3-deoxy-D-manno-octulosonate 8-phosphate phosphatase
MRATEATTWVVILARADAGAAPDGRPSSLGPRAEREANRMTASPRVVVVDQPDRVADRLRAEGAAAPDPVVVLTPRRRVLRAGTLDRLVDALAAGADRAAVAEPFEGELWRCAGASSAPSPVDPDPPLAVVTGEAVAVPAARLLATDASPVESAGRVELVVTGPADALHPADALPPTVGLVVFDFDGVLTDDGVLTFTDGTEAVRSDRGDGYGIEALRTVGVPVLVLSRERNPVVAARCAKLGLECVHGVDDKWPLLRRTLDQRGVVAEDVIYVGNDVNDLDCLRAVACGVVVADAHPAVIEVADLVLTRPGGRGAVRELADLILARRPPDGLGLPSAP